jgi:hypothetical protein
MENAIPSEIRNAEGIKAEEAKKGRTHRVRCRNDVIFGNTTNRNAAFGETGTSRGEKKRTRLRGGGRRGG